MLYTKLPFDRARTIRTLGERLFTRIQNDHEQALIRAFLAQIPDPKVEGPANIASAP